MLYTSTGAAIQPNWFTLWCSIQASADLVKEITVLEGEIIYLERYLLSLYQSAFKPHIPSLSEKSENPFKKNIETDSRVVTDQSCLRRDPNLCKDNPDIHNQSSPANGLAGSDDWNLATTPKLSAKRVSMSNNSIC